MNSQCRENWYEVDDTLHVRCRYCKNMFIVERCEVAYCVHCGSLLGEFEEVRHPGTPRGWWKRYRNNKYREHPTVRKHKERSALYASFNIVKDGENVWSEGWYIYDMDLPRRMFAYVKEYNPTRVAKPYKIVVKRHHFTY